MHALVIIYHICMDNPRRLWSRLSSGWTAAGRHPVDRYAQAHGSTNRSLSEPNITQDVVTRKSPDSVGCSPCANTLPAELSVAKNSVVEIRYRNTQQSITWKQKRSLIQGTSIHAQHDTSRSTVMETDPQTGEHGDAGALKAPFGEKVTAHCVHKLRRPQPPWRAQQSVAHGRRCPCRRN
jgi:hypothetical protein